jgi:hypothetical protein
VNDEISTHDMLTDVPVTLMKYFWLAMADYSIVFEAITPIHYIVAAVAVAITFVVVVCIEGGELLARWSGADDATNNCRWVLNTQLCYSAALPTETHRSGTVETVLVTTRGVVVAVPRSSGSAKMSRGAQLTRAEYRERVAGATSRVAQVASHAMLQQLFAVLRSQVTVHLRPFSDWYLGRLSSKERTEIIQLVCPFIPATRSSVAESVAFVQDGEFAAPDDKAGAVYLCPELNLQHLCVNDNGAALFEMFKAVIFGAELTQLLADDFRELNARSANVTPEARWLKRQIAVHTLVSKPKALRLLSHPNYIIESKKMDESSKDPVLQKLLACVKAGTAVPSEWYPLVLERRAVLLQLLCSVMEEFLQRERHGKRSLPPHQGELFAVLTKHKQVS